MVTKSVSKRPEPPRKALSNLHVSEHLPNLRQYFQRSASQPSTVDNNHYQSTPEHSANHLASAPPSLARTSVFGSCTQVLALVITALFGAINACGRYVESPADNNTTRKAKLLYVMLLERVQKERGEWQGFGDAEPSDNSTTGNRGEQSAMDVLSAHLTSLSSDEVLSIMTELLNVSFYNLRGPLVPWKVYAMHKKQLIQQSLAIPPPLDVLVEIRSFLNELDRTERLCLFRLLTLWHAMAVVTAQSHFLVKTIDEKHQHVISELTDTEFMAACKGNYHDSLAMELLQIMVLYRDVLFSDIEFLLIKQELQLNPAFFHALNNTMETADEPAEDGDDDDQEQPGTVVPVDAAVLAAATAISPRVQDEREVPEVVEPEDASMTIMQALPGMPVSLSDAMLPIPEETTVATADSVAAGENGPAEVQSLPRYIPEDVAQLEETKFDGRMEEETSPPEISSEQMVPSCSHQLIVPLDRHFHRVSPTKTIKRHRAKRIVNRSRHARKGSCTDNDTKASQHEDTRVRGQIRKGEEPEKIILPRDGVTVSVAAATVACTIAIVAFFVLRK